MPYFQSKLGNWVRAWNDEDYEYSDTPIISIYCSFKVFSNFLRKTVCQCMQWYASKEAGSIRKASLSACKSQKVAHCPMMVTFANS